MYSLAGKTVLITGASSGIGGACAEAFARFGARLLLCARRSDRLETVAARVRSIGPVDLHTFALDVRNAEEVERVMREIPSEWGVVDVLVNNAGLARGFGKLHEGDQSDWDEMIDTNVKGLLYVTRAVAPGMVERGRGHIIQIGSIAGHAVYPGGAVYCASKYAVNAISQGLKADLHGTGVRVSTIDPGMVRTEFSLVRFHGDEVRAESVYAGMIPLSAEDIADAVVYCATRPPHVNINQIIMMPTDQSSATLVHRRETEAHAVRQ
jgi:3-hydroxy acid dehydrogenase / malonic semialdehyde reductase